MIKYLGSKRLLLPRILPIVKALPDVHRVLDLFSGTSRVGHALKKVGLDVVANDHNHYAYVLAGCYVQADRRRVLNKVRELIRYLSALPGRYGYFTETYCVQARYFQPENGERVDAIREAIAEMSLDRDVENVLLTSLMEAADRVDSTTGLQMAYLKEWAPRSYNPLQLRVPHVLPGPGLALCMDALDAAREVACDLAYVDPPYNQHKYLGNYHIWESLVLWDKPAVYGVARKRVQCREYASPFNSKRHIARALSDVIDNLRCRHILVSFSNEGYLTRTELESILSRRGRVFVFEVDYRRYVGARIGIYNPDGEKVGRVSHVHNKEHLYFVSEDQRAVDAVAALSTPAAHQPQLL